MKAVGIVVEYNPFHNGHLYHLQETIRKTNADVTIAVMSGTFLQRGEPALINKFTRTKMALAAGVDLVIELPYVFSTQKAETFARGAVLLLDALSVSELCFGSESGEIEHFDQLYNFLNENSIHFNEQMKTFLQQGYSYPKASALAFATFEESNSLLDLSLPNNILGYHYIRAIKELKSSMKASTIKRISAGYHDPYIDDKTIASATAIRKALANESLAVIEKTVPATTFHELVAYVEKYRSFHEWSHYFQLLRYRIATASSDELERIYEAEEGLQHRLQKVIRHANNFSQLMSLLKTKRYTHNRLQRFLTHVLTNTEKQPMKVAQSLRSAPYIHILGMSERGQTYLNKYKKSFKAPLLSQAHKMKDRFLDVEKKASAAYVAILPIEIQHHLLKVCETAPPILYNRQCNTFLSHE